MYDHWDEKVTSVSSELIRTEPLREKLQLSHNKTDQTFKILNRVNYNNSLRYVTEAWRYKSDRI